MLHIPHTYIAKYCKKKKSCLHFFKHLNYEYIHICSYILAYMLFILHYIIIIIIYVHNIFYYA